ncbi:MAG: helix-turn-helix domain-containing protein [Chloroflexi bacterium]|nr:helix-turn-helix domain-containing protein [Chloroflexota bacterium]MBV9895769.1 helix-turn-helix domain-containing protein [Chloroflexota bacterium]
MSETPEALPSEDNGVAPERDGEPAIQAISRAVQMLAFFTEEQPEVSLNELVQRFKLGKTTTHRYATSLRQEGLLRYNQQTGRYSLGIKLIRLGRIAQGSLHLLDVAGPHLESAASDLNESTVLAIWDGALPVVVRVAYPPRRNIFVGVRVGDRLTPAAAQSLVMRAYLNGHDKHEPRLADVRRLGYAVTHYQDTGTVAVARPVFQEGQIAATIAALGTLATIDEHSLQTVADRLGEAADRIGRDLG